MLNGTTVLGLRIFVRCGMNSFILQEEKARKREEALIQKQREEFRRQEAKEERDRLEREKHMLAVSMVKEQGL